MLIEDIDLHHRLALKPFDDPVEGVFTPSMGFNQAGCFILSFSEAMVESLDV